jgi:hypothetical protein
MKKIVKIAVLISGFSGAVFGQAFTENFDDITTLTTSGWFQQNNSAPLGSNPNWFQGNGPAMGGPFGAFNGAETAYIGCNFNSTSGTGTISNWLVTPNRIFKNGDVITFYTRKPTIGAGQTDYPDRMEVRLSTNGASTNVGVGATGTGDFTTLLLSINPSLVVGGYPQIWTQYTITLSGLPAPTSGRIAFRYFVTSGGPLGSNSDYIGLDNVVYTPYVCPTFTMTTAGALTGATAGTSYSTQLSQTGALGTPNFTITSGALPPGLNLSSSGLISGTLTATGTFNFTVTVSDASDCSGTSAYSITSICPPNPIVFAAAPTLCSNATDYSLVEGTPAGGTYSGNGIQGSIFDPSAGTSIIDYNYTDPYGCAFVSNYQITVNNAPAVSQSSFPALCSDDGLLNLSGGSPAGGVYSGTGVSGGSFDPFFGTQTIMYTYSDANGCSNSASGTVVVNIAPTVNHSTIAPLCSNDAPIQLTGGIPSGGVYSGTGVTGNTFDPAVGSQFITYSFTDANGCNDDIAVNVVVNQAPIATLILEPDFLCTYSGVQSLASAGTPAGGTYSGNGIAGLDFYPNIAGEGTHVVVYNYTDQNGCSALAADTFTVDACLGLNAESMQEIGIYPNPGTTEFFISSNQKIESLNIVDVNGRTVPFKKQMTGFTIVGAEMGVYYAIIKTDTSIQTIRFVKQ